MRAGLIVSQGNRFLQIWSNPLGSSVGSRPESGGFHVSGCSTIAHADNQVPDS